MQLGRGRRDLVRRAAGPRDGDDTRGTARRVERERRAVWRNKLTFGARVADSMRDVANAAARLEDPDIEDEWTTGFPFDASPDQDPRRVGEPEGIHSDLAELHGREAAAREVVDRVNEAFALDDEHHLAVR